MASFWLIEALAFSLALAPEVGSAQLSPGPAPAADAVDEATQAEEIGFDEDRTRRMTVAVSLDGAGPYQFLIDTGADRSVVSTQLASNLNLRSGRNALMHSITGAATVKTARVGRLQISDRIAPEVEAALLDRKGLGADGIIGVDALASQRVMFDFKANSMTVVPSRVPAEIRDNDPNAIVVTGKLRHGRLLLTKARAQGRNIRVVVDTGSEVTIANMALREKLFPAGQLRPLGPLELQSVTGQSLTGEMMLLKSLEIGGIELKDLLIVFAPAHTFRQLDMEDRPALLLGMNAMRAFDKVSIDFASRKLRLIMPEKSARDPVRMARDRLPGVSGQLAVNGGRRAVVR